MPRLAEIGMMVERSDVMSPAEGRQRFEGFNMAKGRQDQKTRESPRPTPLGAWVRSVRTEQAMSQRGLADRAGLSRSYLCDIERGRGSQPSMETLDKLSAALGLSRNELLRAAGMIEGGLDERHTSDERRLLAVFRDLDDGGRTQVMRFARFVHAEEHTWVQPGLGDEGSQSSLIPVQTGPTLFDLDTN
ncbi:hypothetical protein BH24CHL2_BH24CHL2_1700 [soil metagenome]